MLMEKHVARPHESEASIESTLLDLVQLFAQEGRPEPEIVELVLQLVDNGDVTLTGNFRGQPLVDDA